VQYMTECPLCRFARGEDSASVLYEDEHVLCFLNQNPLTTGHSLVIPKKHYAALTDLPPDELARCTSVFQKMVRQIARALKVDGFNLIQNNGEAAGQSIGHVHFHLVPRFEEDGYITSWSGEPASSDRLEEVRKEISKVQVTTV
jgi:histidine triad (HIT) family protein